MHDKRGQRSGRIHGFERLSQCKGRRPRRLGDLDQEHVSVSNRRLIF